MMHSTRNVFFSIIAIVAILTFFSLPTFAQNDDLSELCKDPKNAASSLCVGYDKGVESADTDSNPVLKLLTNVISVLSFFVGVLAVGFVIYGGFKYIVSAGDASKVASAKNTILYALVGLLVVVIARQLILFVLSKVIT
jgi:hypothetical protein